jgi:hypothetical protein
LVSIQSFDAFVGWNLGTAPGASSPPQVSNDVARQTCVLIYARWNILVACVRAHRSGRVWTRRLCGNRARHDAQWRSAHNRSYRESSDLAPAPCFVGKLPAIEPRQADIRKQHGDIRMLSRAGDCPKQRTASSFISSSQRFTLGERRRLTPMRTG